MREKEKVKEANDEAYEAAKERQKALMRAGKRLREDGESLPSREEVYER